MERLGDAAVRRAARRSVGLRLQHRHPGLRRRARVRHAARRVHPHAHHRSARDEGHAFLPAGGRARSAGRGVFERTPTAGSRARRKAPRGQGHYVEGPRRSFAGGAGLLSTARDYARFLEMIRNGGALGAVRILSPRTVAADDDQPDRHAALGDRTRASASGFETDRSVRRQRAGFSGRVRMGRRLRHHLPGRSRVADW